MRARALERCEYCRIPQAGQEATFHVDHIVPLREEGPTTLDNLALACVSCSLRKGARRFVSAPGTDSLVALFHPRVDRWADHFSVAAGGVLRSDTAIGRATIEALAMNRPAAVAIRSELMRLQRYP